MLCDWQDFAAFARARDVAEKRKEAFELPYAIDGDRVGGLTIKLIFNKLDRWSKALKYMVADLKWALKCESFRLSQKAFIVEQGRCSHLEKEICVDTFLWRITEAAHVLMVAVCDAGMIAANDGALAASLSGGVAATQAGSIAGSTGAVGNH